MEARHMSAGASEELELLTRLLQQEGFARPSELPRTDARDCVPLSYAQERLWFLERMGLAGVALHVPIGLRLTGALDEAALQAALRNLVQRHESLRTRFVEQEGNG